MMIQLNFLGPAEIQIDGRTMAARLDRKHVALLAYLAVQRGWVARDKAADLLWGDAHLDGEALRNLRQAIYEINRLYPNLIEIDGRRFIRLGPAVRQHLDVEQFEVARSNGDFELAAALYRGPFLDGLSLKNAEALEEWLLAQREQFERLALGSLKHAMQTADHRRDNDALERFARHALTIDPLREDAARRLMLALARKRQFNPAMQTFRAITKRLETELGITPSAETMAVYERILSARAVPQPKLPYHEATFVGREQELAEAAARLLDPACRLLTLVGPGGVGKTRLGIELARRIRRLFLHDLGYLTLEGRTAAGEDDLPAAIAGSLGLPASGGPLLSQLGDHLRPRETLLILDNFEPFVPAGHLLHTLLKEAPGLKILVTSRERLDLPDEWLYPVGGMTCPPEPGLLDMTTPTSAGYDAPALLARLVGRLNPAGVLSDDPAAVDHICRLVDGLPLALELVAPWVLDMPLAAIAERLAGEPADVIRIERRHPGRHRSLSVVFEHSWSRLMPKEQAIMRRLAVIMGNITPAAAEAIAGAADSLLLRLAAQSMLETPDEGRYAMHPLVRAFALEKLVEADELEATHAGHFDYFGRFVAAQLPELHGPGQLEALRQLEDQFANIRAAWRYGAEHAPAQALETMSKGIIRLCRARTWYGTGIEVLQEGIEPLIRRKETYLSNLLLLHQGLMHYHLGNYEAAQRCAQAGSQGNDGRLEVPALFLTAAILYDQNRYDEAEPLLLRSVELNQQNGAYEATGDALVRLGNLSLLRTFFSHASKIPYKPPRAFVNEHRMPTSEQKAGAEAALRYYEEALNLFTRVESWVGIAHCRGAIGFARYILHDYAAAADAFEQVARQFGQLESAAEEADSLMWLAWARHHQGRTEEARLIFHEALRIGLRVSAYKGLLDCLQKYSLHLWVADERHPMPLAINALVAQHPNTGERMRTVALEWLDNIRDYMLMDEGKEAVERALQFGRQQTIGGLIRLLLMDADGAYVDDINTVEPQRDSLPSGQRFMHP